MTGYATPWSLRDRSAVAGLLRCDERVHTKRPLPSSNRRPPSVGTAPTLSMVSSIIVTACCLSEVWLVARAAITCWALSTTA